MAPLLALPVLTGPPAGLVWADAPLTVFAAASLQEVLHDTAGRFQASTGVAVRLSLAASSTLARQIAAGAPADVYVAAHPKWLTWLRGRRRLSPAGGVPVLSNRLVLIAPARGAPSRPLMLTRAAITARLDGGRLAVGDPAHVPAGLYAKAALTSLGLWGVLAPRLARAANTRAALALVALAEAPLGIVYRSDAVAEPRVRQVALLPATSHPPIVYIAAAVDGPRRPLARRFIRRFVADAAAGRFDRFGFSRAAARPARDGAP